VERGVTTPGGGIFADNIDDGVFTKESEPVDWCVLEKST
jgi:hypothetical protein